MCSKLAYSDASLCTRLANPVVGALSLARVSFHPNRPSTAAMPGLGVRVGAKGEVWDESEVEVAG